MTRSGLLLTALLVALPVCSATAAVSIPFTVTLSEVVTVTGTPEISVDVGGTARFATYSGGTGTNTLTFTLSPQSGDVDLDGVTVSSPILLNGGTIKDAAGNDATLTFTPPDTSGIKVDYPSLSLNFIADSDGRFTLNGTVYNDFPALLSAASGSFTRGSIGTYFDSAGTLQTASAGTPRFDYDPVTHVAKGLLIEGSRTNQLTYSDQIDNSIWIKTGSLIIPDTSNAPDNTLTADTYISGAGRTARTSYIQQSGLAQPGVISYFAKSAGNNYFIIVRGYFNDGDYAIFNLSTGVISTNPTYSGSLAKMDSVGNGWYRCYLISSRTDSPSSIIAFSQANNNSLDGTTMDGIAGVYIWGAQFEQGAFPTSYIPTTAAAVTRSADNISIPVGSWFSASSGSIAMTADLYLSGATAIQQGITIHGGGNQGYLFYKQAATSNIYAFAGTAQSNLGTVSSNTPFKIGMTYDASAAIASLNGSLSGSVTPTSVTAPTTLDISSSPGGQWNGHLSSYKFYPLRATNAQLQLLTQ